MIWQYHCASLSSLGIKINLLLLLKCKFEIIMYLDHGLSLQEKSLWQKMARTVPKAKSRHINQLRAGVKTEFWLNGLQVFSCKSSIKKLFWYLKTSKNSLMVTYKKNKFSIPITFFSPQTILSGLCERAFFFQNQNSISKPWQFQWDGAASFFS